MIDSFGNPTFVYNPFTYAELITKLRGMDKYLECISRHAQDGETSEISCFQIEPKIYELDRQGVSGISVFQKCKANYQQKQWDDGAFLLYDRAMLKRHLKGVQEPSIDGGDGIGECLLKAERDGGSNLACVQLHTR